MKRSLITLTIALTTLFASAQTDSLSMENKTYNLNEVVVKSDVALTSAEKSTYLPTRKQRNAATDAVALLQHMMIPQLQIDPMTEEVKTIANEDVAIFIDYLPATKEDLQGMNTQDVKRVEIYDFPKDVRFQNKPHVVNFVMQKYETGGYTKLSTTEMVLADFASVNSVYSKLAHKRWTFDANMSNRYNYRKHNGIESEETFILPNQTIARTENASGGTMRSTTNSASLRAAYNTEKVQLSNRLELLDKNTPTQELQGSVAYNPTLINSTAFTSRRTSHELTPTFSGDWNFFFPRNWSLSIAPQFQYIHNKQSRFYQESSTIENEIKEDATDLTWNIGISKNLSDKHTVSLKNYGLNYTSDLDYKGSTTSNSKMSIFGAGQGVQYTFSTQKLYLMGEFVYAFQRNKVNGESQTEHYPIVNFLTQYSPNSHHQLTLRYHYSNGGAMGSQRNPNVMQENELMFYCGNPSLRNFQSQTIQLQHNWMPSNTFSLSSYVQHRWFTNYYANIYETHNDGTALIRKIENAGNINTTKIGTSATLRLLDGNLQLSADPELNIINAKGRYSESSTQFALDINASYYLGQFYFMSGYTTPIKSYDRTTAVWQRDRSFYYLTAGWGNAHWKAKLDIVNPFRTDWRSTRTEISTPLYTQMSKTFNSSSHQRLNLTVSYTFNYGKKVKRGNELGTATGGQSSIL